MASNKELVEQASALAKDLGVDVATSGLNNQELQALVGELTKRAEEATSPKPTEPPPVPTPPPAAPSHKPFDGAGENALGGAPPAKREEPPLKFAYQVPPRCSLVTRKGVQGEGEEVTAQDLNEDPKVAAQMLVDLVKGGHLIEGKRRGPARDGRG